jgi:glycosyltransferase involved in cell wall biosynthesis
VQTLYAACDVFALSSIREGLPNVLLEAMAMRVPVVATRIAGVPLVLEHETSGLLVRPHDPRELATALMRLLMDKDQCERLAERAYQTVAAKFSFATRMKRMVEVYQELGRPDVLQSA